MPRYFSAIIFTEWISIPLGGFILPILHLDKAIKAVGRNNIEVDVVSQLVIALGGILHCAASGKGIFNEISQQTVQIRLCNMDPFRDIRVPVQPDPIACGQLCIVIQKRVDRMIFAELPDLRFRQGAGILCEILLQGGCSGLRPWSTVPWQTEQNTAADAELTADITVNKYGVNEDGSLNEYESESFRPWPALCSVAVSMSLLYHKQGITARLLTLTKSYGFGIL